MGRGRGLSARGDEAQARLVAPYIALAQEYAQRSDHAKASEAYATALALRPDMVTLLRGAADVALKSKRLDEAARVPGAGAGADAGRSRGAPPPRAVAVELRRFPEARDAAPGVRRPPRQTRRGLGGAGARVRGRRGRAGRGLGVRARRRPAPGRRRAAARRGRGAWPRLESTRRPRRRSSARRSSCRTGRTCTPRSARPCSRSSASTLRQRALARAVKLAPRAGASPRRARARGDRAGDLQGAAESLEQAVRLDGSDTDALLLLADAYRRQSRAPDATGALRRADRRAPGRRRSCTSSSPRTCARSASSRRRSPRFATRRRGGRASSRRTSAPRVRRAS